VAVVAGVRFGGQPGEHPTCCAGTIFYHGHKIVEDEEKGIFDRERAEGLVKRQAELSSITGNPSVLHIYARTLEAFERYLSWSEQIWEGPLIIDSAQPAARMGMAGLVSELGYADKVIYNSLSLATGEEELLALRGSELDSAILLAYNPMDSSVDGCLAALETGGGLKDRGLISLARDLGMTNLLLDPGALPVGSGAGSALRFSVVAKAKLGLPTGSGIHNAVSAWPWLKDKEREINRCCDAAACSMQILSGGDFILYGPIENAEFIFPVAAMADIMVAEAVKDLEIWPVSSHPFHRLA
jgi:tetrahydromethanopterin S-methyltransferase subunit H